MVISESNSSSLTGVSSSMYLLDLLHLIDPIPIRSDLACNAPPGESSGLLGDVAG